jgi:23S rRNA (uracil1939-C5)-methyltransferase
MMSSESTRNFLAALKGTVKIAPKCPHVTEQCGGCLLQEYEYSEQLRAKTKLLDDIYMQDVKIHPAHEPSGYRSRMDFVLAFDKCGLRVRGSHTKVVDVKDCHLLPPAARSAYVAARDIILSSGLPTYDYLAHVGFMRYVVVRVSKTTNEIMIVLTTKKPTPEQEQQMRELLNKIHNVTNATSVWWTINDPLNDISVGQEYAFVGKDHIVDEIADVSCKIGPRTFFQGNTDMASKLFSDAMQHVKGDVLDLCCGVGILSFLALQQDAVTSVLGVELNSSSIEAAKENIALNNHNNKPCEFICADMTDFLLKTEKKFTTVICDPARAGLGKEACNYLLDIAPERIVYISCNPFSHKDDMDRLKSEYDCVLLESYDLFPQTPHLEMLSVFIRRDIA